MLYLCSKSDLFYSYSYLSVIENDISAGECFDGGVSEDRSLEVSERESDSTVFSTLDEEANPDFRRRTGMSFGIDKRFALSG